MDWTMRINYKFIGFIAAAAAMSLVSCQKQEFKPSTDGTVITVNANVEDPANISKTYVEEADGVYNINWSDSESMAAVSFTGNEANVYKSSSFTLNEDGSGIFTLKDENLSSGKETIAGVYPYDASVSGNKYSGNFRVELPSTQNPVAGSYDPNAYVMIARPESLETIAAAGNVWNAYYYRAAALNRFSVTGLEHGGEITSARIIFAEKTNAAGRRYFDLSKTTPGKFYRNEESSPIYENIITLKYATPLISVENEYNLWFTTWNVEVPTTSSFTVEITTDSYKYTKEFVPKKDGFVLAENCLNLVALDMADATAEELTPAEDYSGEYLIVGLSKTWNYMTSTSGSGYFERGATDISKAYEELSCADFYAQTGIEDCVWKFTSTGEGLYKITSTDGKFLTISGKNASLSENERSLYVEKQKDGSYWIKENSSTEFRLQYNASDPRFKPYDSNQIPIFLVTWIESTEPTLSVSQPEQTVAADAESVSFTYVARNITGEITAEEGTDADNIISAVSIDEISSTVNVTLNPNTEEVDKTATIILSAEGVEDITLSIIQRSSQAVPSDISLTFPDDNKENNNVNDYTSTWTAISGEYTFTISNFNNANWSNWTYIRCGRNKDASVASIKNETAMPKLSSVEVTVDKADKSTKINSVTLTIYSDAENTVQVGETIERTNYTPGMWEFTIPENIQADGLYYKLTFDCAAAGSNGIIQISKVLYVAAQ